MFFKVTEQDKANEVSAHWKAMYFDMDKENRDKWYDGSRFNTSTIYEQLCALPFPKDIDAIGEAIGNSTWTWLECYFCSESIEEGVAIVTEFLCEHELICKKCLKKALKLLK